MSQHGRQAGSWSPLDFGFLEAALAANLITTLKSGETMYRFPDGVDSTACFKILMSINSPCYTCRLNIAPPTILSTQHIVHAAWMNDIVLAAVFGVQEFVDKRAASAVSLVHTKF